jgi:hypothetical protein
MFKRKQLQIAADIRQFMKLGKLTAEEGIVSILFEFLSLGCREVIKVLIQAIKIAV